MLPTTSRVGSVSSDSRFTEVADRVWVARHEWYDVNVVAVGGSDGLVVVDTNASTRAGRAVLEGLRAVSALPVVTVVNTHDHFDHVFGNAAFGSAYAEAPIVAHEEAAAAMGAGGASVRAAARAWTDPRAAEIVETEVVTPNRTFSSAMALDLGDRAVELVHPGRGHTAGDLVVRVPDADVVLAGDLVEQSAPPSYGEDCWPLEWPTSLDLVLQLIGPSTVVVPGHGAPVDRDFVQEQRADIGVVAETIRHLAGTGVSVSDALEQGEWPWDGQPAERLRHAVARGYEQLPRSQKRLPLL